MNYPSEVLESFSWSALESSSNFSGSRGLTSRLDDRFGFEFVGAVEETVHDLLGARVIDPFFTYVAHFTGFRKVEIPARCDEFFKALNRGFGRAGPVLGRSIVKRLYARLGMQFIDKRRAPLEYVQEARATLERA